MRKKKQIIWSNINIDENDWLDEEGHPMTWDDIYDSLNYTLEDELSNLDIVLENPILIIADLGLWNGRKQGYKVIDSCNIKDILCTDNDYVEWYAENGNIKCIKHHHDGTNFYTYRVIKNMDNIDNLLADIYDNKHITTARLNYYTTSLYPAIAKVYGW